MSDMGIFMEYTDTETELRESVYPNENGIQGIGQGTIRVAADTGKSYINLNGTAQSFNGKHVAAFSNTDQRKFYIDNKDGKDTNKGDSWQTAIATLDEAFKRCNEDGITDLYLVLKHHNNLPYDWNYCSMSNIAIRIQGDSGNTRINANITSNSLDGRMRFKGCQLAWYNIDLYVNVTGNDERFLDFDSCTLYFSNVTISSNNTTKGIDIYGSYIAFEGPVTVPSIKGIAINGRVASNLTFTNSRGDLYNFGIVGGSNIEFAPEGWNNDVKIQYNATSNQKSVIYSDISSKISFYNLVTFKRTNTNNDYKVKHLFIAQGGCNVITPPITDSKVSDTTNAEGVVGGYNVPLRHPSKDFGLVNGIQGGAFNEPEDSITYYRDGKIIIHNHRGGNPEEIEITDSSLTNFNSLLKLPYYARGYVYYSSHKAPVDIMTQHSYDPNKSEMPAYVLKGFTWFTDNGIQFTNGNTDNNTLNKTLNELNNKLNDIVDIPLTLKITYDLETSTNENNLCFRFSKNNVKSIKLEVVSTPNTGVGIYGIYAASSSYMEQSLES